RCRRRAPVSDRAGTEEEPLRLDQGRAPGAPGTPAVTGVPGRRTIALALALAALTLRPQLVAIGPLAPRIEHGLGGSDGLVGLLSAIPVLCMGLFAPSAARVAARIGAWRGVTLALSLIALFGLLRAGAGAAALVVVLTVPIGVGMGLGNALMAIATN